jgi:hypothetical protein
MIASRVLMLLLLQEVGFDVVSFLNKSGYFIILLLILLVGVVVLLASRRRKDS